MTKEMIPASREAKTQQDSLNDFALWANEMAEAGIAPTPADLAEWQSQLVLDNSRDTDSDWNDIKDFDENGIEQFDEASLERRVLENPEEPQTAWAESNPNGTVTEEQYRQKSYWVIGQFGHAMDVLKTNISTDAEAEEWLEMKMTVTAAKAETGSYALADVRSKMIPIWSEYITRMNVDWEEYERVCNK